MNNNISLSQFLDIIMGGTAKLDIWINYRNSKGVTESNYHSTIQANKPHRLSDKTAIMAYILAAVGSPGDINSVNIEHIVAENDGHLTLIVSNRKEKYS